MLSDICTRPVKAPLIWQESFTQDIPRICIAGRWNGDFGCRHWGSGYFGRVLNPCSTPHAKEVFDATKEWTFYLLGSRRNSKVIQKRPRIPRTHSNAGSTCNEWRPQRRTEVKLGEVSADRNKRWRWSPQRLLVSGRNRHHVEPRVRLYVPKQSDSQSHWSTLTWRDQDYAHKSGCVARKTYQRLLECRRESKFIRIMYGIHEVHFTVRKTSSRIHVVRERLTKIQATTRPHYLWPEIWIGMSKAAKKQEQQERAIEKPESKLRGIYFIDWED